MQAKFLRVAWSAGNCKRTKAALRYKMYKFQIALLLKKKVVKLLG